jgi:TPP-dependent pyruvate/acetoin dehydrogenase alpha subunit
MGAMHGAHTTRLVEGEGGVGSGIDLAVGVLGAALALAEEDLDSVVAHGEGDGELVIVVL